MQMHADDPQELIRPAVEGTVNVLKSASKYGLVEAPVFLLIVYLTSSSLRRPSVKRVVVTSSAVAMLEPKSADQTPYTYTEADWNEASERAVNDLGSKASMMDKYIASKTLAERAAWSFVEANKDKISFDLTVINPSYIFGPIIHEVKNVDALNTSHAFFRAAIRSNDADLTPEKTGEFLGNLVDVRTVARAHTLALQKEEAGGKRFLTSVAPFSWQDICKLLSAPSTQLVANSCVLLLLDDALNAAGAQGVPKGHPGSQQHEAYNPQDNAQSRRILGLDFISLKQLAVDTLNDLKERFGDEF